MCVHCLGVVFYKESDIMSCSVCAGYSSENCPCCSEDLDVIECPECEGLGVDEEGFPCDVCKGHGSVYRDKRDNIFPII